MKERTYLPPSLDLLESLQLRYWDKDYDGFLASSALHLLGGGDVQLPQGGLKVRVDLQVQNCLRDLLLNLIRFRIMRLDNLAACKSHASEIFEK